MPFHFPAVNSCDSRHCSILLGLDQRRASDQTRREVQAKGYTAMDVQGR